MKATFKHRVQMIDFGGYKGKQNEKILGILTVLHKNCKTRPTSAEGSTHRKVRCFRCNVGPNFIVFLSELILMTQEASFINSFSPSCVVIQEAL